MSSTANSTSSSTASNSSISFEEKAVLPWDGYEEDALPEKNQGKRLRNLRHLVFSIYRRLFGVVFLTNMGVFIWTIWRQSNANEIATIVVANIFVAILMRQDYVINAFFNVFCCVPTSWPLWIRTLAARVYFLGGLHSGCGVSGTIWLILFAARATQEFIQDRTVSVPTLAVTYVIILLLVLMLALAFPSLRAKKHDTFEQTHRFMGWTATAFVWALIILVVNDYKPADKPLAFALVRAAPFWLIIIITISLILPWLRLRKYAIKSEVLSSHAVRLYFDYDTPVPGSFVRISHNPLFEWHSFATIAVPKEKGFSVIISRAGDWTINEISNPPSHIWVRNIPVCGVVNVCRLFKRVVLVATGSGIAPLAPWVFNKSFEYKLLWSAPNVRETFGDKLVDSLVTASPDAVIYDTRKHGKPDMVKLTLRLVREFNAEAVCIISNPALTRKVVYGMMSRGVPAFGAIWDS